MDKIKEVCQIQVGEGFKARVDESGNILIEKEKFVPKDGDYMFYITSSNSPVISISKGVKDNKLMSYADFFIDNNNLFNSYGRTTGYTGYYDAMIDIRLATPEEKEKLDKKLEEIGLLFNSTTKVLEKIYQPKEGDFFYCEIGEGQVYSILKDIIDGQVKVYCTLLVQYNDFYTSGNLASVLSCKNMRLATTKERDILLDRIKVERYFWNFTKKVLEEAYKPKDGDIIYNQGGDHAIAIFNRFEESTVKTYCSYFYHANVLYVGNNLAGSDNYFCNINSFNPRLATEAEKLVLFEQLKKKKDLVWNAETKTLDPIYVPKEGDIVHYITNNSEGIAIFKEICGDIFYRHCVVYKNEDDKTYNRNILGIGHIHSFSKFKEIRLATEEERNILFTHINAANKVWNSDLKILCTIPKIGDLCIFWNLLSENAVIDILERVTSSSFLASKQGFYDKCVLYNEELYKKMIRYVKA